jgi:cell division protein ZapA (FtsZ GTPase activity inhibitor)
MEVAPKKHKVTIFGDSYTIMSDEAENAVAQLAHLVDSLMTDIAKRTLLTDSKKIAVLTALHLASRLHTRERQLEEHLKKTSARLDSIIDQTLQHRS